MEVHLSSETEARLSEAAIRSGKQPSQIIEEAVQRMLDYETKFIEAVAKGRASAERGDLIEHEDVIERMKRVLES